MRSPSVETIWLRSVIAAVVVTALWTAPVHAGDLWDSVTQKSVTQTQIQGGSQPGVNFRGGLGVPLPPGGASGGTVASVSVAGGGGCTTGDFASEFKAMFNADALGDYFKGIASSAISAAPMLLLCYASPTLCDQVKHFKTMAQGVLAVRSAECQAIESAAMDAGKRMGKARQSQCIDEKTAGGAGMVEALDACKDAGSEWTGIDLKPLTSGMDVVQEALKRTGASEDVQKLAKAVLGDVRVTGSGASKKVEFTPMPEDGTEKQWGTYYQGYAVAFDAVLETVKAGGTPTLEELQKVSAPGVPMTPLMLRQIASLEPGPQFVARQKYVSALTYGKYIDSLHGLKVKLSDASRIAANTSQNHEALDRQTKVVDTTLDRVRALKSAADQAADALADAQVANAAARQKALTTNPPASKGGVVGAPSTTDGPALDLGGGLRATPRRP